MSNHINGISNGAIWFRLQGDIDYNNTNNNSNSWSEWFVKNNTFTTRDATYVWNQTLSHSVGNATTIAVLTRQDDAIQIAEIGVDELIYQFSPDIWLDYDYGM